MVAEVDTQKGEAGQDFAEQPIIPALRKKRSKNEVEGSQSYKASSKLAWAKHWGLVSEMLAWTT